MELFVQGKKFNTIVFLRRNLFVTIKPTLFDIFVRNYFVNELFTLNE